jgi:RNA polymerase sigma factor for flagellar operon FliA
VGLVSADTRKKDSEDLPMPEFPAPPATQPDQICARREMAGALGSAIRLLPERYQLVVRMYYTSEMTMKQIGGFLGVNESRVSQIHKSALARMAEALAATGIESSRAF